MDRKVRILLVGGGSGGHIYPLIAVAQAIRQQSPVVEISYAGQPGKFLPILLENRIRVIKIASSKRRRYFSFLNFVDFFKFGWGFCQALWKLYWFMPDAVFSKGGPGALPVILACRFYFIPIVIHESDTVPGRTNQISGRFSRKIFLSFREAEQFFQPGVGKIEAVGQPIRSELLTGIIASDEAKTALGFSIDLPLVLFLGGSQGSERINDFVLSNLNLLLMRSQILHQVGQENYSAYQKEYEAENYRLNPEFKNRYRFAAYLNGEEPFALARALSAADVVVSRAGAGAIFESACAGKPLILIPLTESAGNHQMENAFVYQKTGGAILIEEENFLPNLFENVLDGLLKNPAKIQAMSAAARAFYRPDAAVKIANAILQISNH